MSVRSNRAVVAMLKTAPEPLAAGAELVASMLQGAMVGVSELIFLACAYLSASSHAPAIAPARPQ